MEKLLHERLMETKKGQSWLTVRPYDDEFIIMRSEAERIADEIERYYIPRPRFEDGEFVNPPCEIEHDGETTMLHGYNIRDNGHYELHIGIKTVHMKPDERLKRPTQKVYDADGVEIKVGQVLWNMTGDKALRILALDTNFDLEPVIQTDDGRFNPDQLTHEKPVFDADNVRICKGDTVWGTLLGDKHEVSLVKNGCVYLDDGSICFEPNQLTHKEPDSLEKLQQFAVDHAAYADGSERDAFMEIADRLTALIERGA